METIVTSQNVFLNSETNIQGNGTRFSVRCHDLLTLPKDADFFRVVLNEFSMRRLWYKVNSTNNVFVVNLYNSSNWYTFKAYITQGDYATRTALCDAICSALTTAIAANGFSSLYSSITTVPTTIETDKLFNITVTHTAGTWFYLSFNKDPSFEDGTPYSNAYRLFGGKVNVTDLGADDKCLVNTETSGTILSIKGWYPMCLDTESHIYLRTHMVNDSLSNHHGVSNLTDNTVIGTNVLGKIVITEDWCTYDSSDLKGGTWWVDVPYKNISDLSFYISDGDGRDLPLINKDQNTKGGLFVKMSLIVQAMKRQYY